MIRLKELPNVRRNYRRLQELPPDLQIQTADRLFPAHKTILVAGSDYFYRLLLGNFAKKETVELPDIPGEIFQPILDVLYQEKFPVLDTVEDYRSFSQYLDYFGIKVEESLITLTRFPTELIMQIADLETVKSMGKALLSREDLPVNLIVDLYQCKLIDEEMVDLLYEQLENPVETLVRLHEIGYPEQRIEERATLGGNAADFVGAFRRLRLKVPEELLETEKNQRIISKASRRR
ncbi:MAG: BTB/POZ domain-containing protein [Nitrososphaerales archaeon]